MWELACMVLHHCMQCIQSPEEGTGPLELDLYTGINYFLEL